MKHPLEFLVQLGKDKGILTFQFAAYKHSPDPLRSDKREILQNSAIIERDYDILKDWAGKDGRDLEVQSPVVLSDHKEMHIPMIDFATEKIDEHIPSIKKVMQEFSIRRAYLFHSGRSYHLYGVDLINNSNWMRFMGTVILLNPENPGTNNGRVFDLNWIGRCLINGCSSLRLSNNQDHYVGLHEFYKTIQQ